MKCLVTADEDHRHRRQQRGRPGEGCGAGRYRSQRDNRLPIPANAARANIAAVSTDLPAGIYRAPRFKQSGNPKATKVREKACDPVMARRLWEMLAELTGCDWPAPHRRNERPAVP
ncbi:hypothetical protein A5659_14455 [Mycobacterium sp. 1165196.3]|uniref:hypothetical protein n=1 Tax=Mycobacterium sp. 1165196.3 TaxID=1834071 RepID=UPI0007FF8D54|nr:hypothetical protein [Mycobacterium sp. 1165196.3]OBK38448.1 hypothetical protein A5659_14455 [Mycobacterium sp. 1165196.3]